MNTFLTVVFYLQAILVIGACIIHQALRPEYVVQIANGYSFLLVVYWLLPATIVYLVFASLAWWKEWQVKRSTIAWLVCMGVNALYWLQTWLQLHVL